MPPMGPNNISPVNEIAADVMFGREGMISAMFSIALLGIIV